MNAQIKGEQMPVKKSEQTKKPKLEFKKIDEDNYLNIGDLKIVISGQTINWLKRAEKENYRLIKELLAAANESEAINIIVQIKGLVQKVEQMEQQGEILNGPVQKNKPEPEAEEKVPVDEAIKSEENIKEEENDKGNIEE